MSNEPVMCNSIFTLHGGPVFTIMEAKHSLRLGAEVVGNTNHVFLGIFRAVSRATELRLAQRVVFISITAVAISAPITDCPRTGRTFKVSIALIQKGL